MEEAGAGIGAAPKTRRFARAVPDYELIGNTPAACTGFLRRDAALISHSIARWLAT
jgi:hypothetical protein